MTNEKHHCSNCDDFPVVNMPPKSEKPCTIFVDPKCKFCGHKHDKYVVICTGCYESIKRDGEIEFKKLEEERRHQQMMDDTYG